MSIGIVKEQIDNFLGSEAPEVLAIRGAWGIGKTFAWNKFLCDARDQNRVALGKYSYVSLFGVESLHALKFSIFEQAIGKNLIGKRIDLDTFRTNALGLTTSFGKKALQFIKAHPSAEGLGSAIERLAFLSFSKAIVCIDDLERKGASLETQDVMGLISTLKEHKGCKVVLILNDDELSPSDLNAYQRLGEKVFDRDLEFSPTARECAGIALSGNDQASRDLREASELLGVNNIRIIRRAADLARQLMPLLSEMDREVVSRAHRSLLLFCWCYLDRTGRAPNPLFVKQLERTFPFSAESKEATQEEKEWSALLRRYDHIYSLDFDRSVAKAVETGYPDREEFLAEARKLDLKIVSERGRRRLIDAWAVFERSFADNETEVIAALWESSKSNMEHISLGEISRVLYVLRGLKRDDLASEIVDAYILEQKGQAEVIDVDRYPLEIDNQLRLRLVQEFRPPKQARSPRDAMAAMADRPDTWSSRDVEILAKASPEEYYEIFKNENERLLELIDACLRFSRIANPSDQDKRIVRNASEALRRIGEESLLNSLRLESLGLKIEDFDAS